MTHRILARASARAAFCRVALTLLLMVAGLVAAEGQQSTTPASANETEHFALLIGVNDYAQPSDNAYHVTPLKGPANDVALMKDLLVNYGFKDDPQHVLTLL